MAKGEKMITMNQFRVGDTVEAHGFGLYDGLKYEVVITALDMDGVYGRSTTTGMSGFYPYKRYKLERVLTPATREQLAASLKAVLAILGKPMDLTQEENDALASARSMVGLND